jgi:hypothetical protein
LFEQLQWPFPPALVVLVVLIAFANVFIWAWAVRRPARGDNAGSAQEATPAPPRPPVLVVVAPNTHSVGTSDYLDGGWVEGLRALLPEGTRLVRLGRNGMTLRQAVELEIPQAAIEGPNVVVLWCCVNDAVTGVPLQEYEHSLRLALHHLTTHSDARVLLLNLPDITVPAYDRLDPDRRDLIRGGVSQWNRSIARVAAEFGDRVALLDLYAAGNRIFDHGRNPQTADQGYLAQAIWHTMHHANLLPGADR